MASAVLSSVVHSTLATGTYTPRDIGQIYTVDLNNDGNSDLLVLGASYPYSGAAVPQPSLVAFGDGKGGFATVSQTIFPFASMTTVHPREVVFADFNGDGFKDVFIADHGFDAAPFPGAQNRLFLSSGNGTWRDATANLPAIADFSHSVTVGDVNGDGAPDIFVGNVPRPNVVNPYILINNGAGAFTRNDAFLPTGTGGALNPDVRRVTADLLTDLDGDGRADLVLGAAFSTRDRPVTSQILWNTGGGFAQAPATDLSFPAFFGKQQLVYDAQAIDVNYDGRMDLVLAYQGDVGLGGWELQVLINQGGRNFVDQTTTYLPEPAARNGGTPSASSPESQAWVQFFCLADINGDGRMDFTLDQRGITSAPASMPYAYLHQADGSFATVTAGALAATTGPWMFDFTTQYASWGVTGAGFVHVAAGAGNVTAETLPVAFSIPTQMVLASTAGNDALTGGTGRDTAVFSGARSAYTVAHNPTGFTVTSTAQGTDTLVSIERLQFADAKLAVDVSGNGGMAYRLYQAAFNRTPDQGGLGYQMHALDVGLDISQVAQNFINSPEFTATYGALDNTRYVTQLYQNVLHRAPDAGGLAFHTGNLASGANTRANVLVGFSESPENQAALIGTIQDGMVYTL